MVRNIGGTFREQQVVWWGWGQDPGSDGVQGAGQGAQRAEGLEYFAMNFGPDSVGAAVEQE